jgi:hypothetical protein
MHAARLLAATLWLTVAAIMVQAVLAGSGLFGSPGLFELHGWIGSGVLVLAAVASLLAFVARQGAVVTFGSVILAAASISQIGMGYAGRRGGNVDLSAIHVPVGVAMLGLAVAIAVLATVEARKGEA